MPPLNTHRFTQLRSGVFESEDIDVMINESGDFAFLFPQPVMDYSQYKPRSQRLGLQTYKSNNDVINRRLQKIGKYLAGVENYLEIGASDGGFVAMARNLYPQMHCACIEPDQSTKQQRDALDWLHQFDDFGAAISSGRRFNAIGFFHVFEHIEDPASFLEQCTALLAPGGRIIVEVPSLTDPLLGLYELPAYQKFYFQKQHPYVYSGASLAKVLEHNGLEIQHLIPYQRYGIENHLTWLSKGKPGGSEDFREQFAHIDDGYRAALEASATTDTVIAVAGVCP